VRFISLLASLTAAAAVAHAQQMRPPAVAIVDPVEPGQSVPATPPPPPSTATTPAVPLPAGTATTPALVPSATAPKQDTGKPASDDAPAELPLEEPAHHYPSAALLNGAFKDGSKVDDRVPDKVALTAKVKECCGYPIAEQEGFRLSFYWLAYESDYANEAYDVPIYTRRGYYIGSFPSAFIFELKLEGSGVLRDGRILNYDGDCNYGMGTCFKTLALDQHPLGAGVQSRPLVPFRSIAVDPRYIPIGAPVYVPELVGALMPDGTRHDGCLRADDMGGAIKEHKLDFFVESYFNFKFIADNLWWRMRATPLLDEPRCEYLRAHDPRERDNEHSDWASLHKNLKQRRMAEKLALRKTARNRAMAKAWLARHSGSSKTAVAHKR
jgi:3D (Asp-Asp-Asp) domain-containing protein